MLRRIRWMLSQGSPAPGARHALPRRSLARASVISVALSSLLLVPLASEQAPAEASAVEIDKFLSLPDTSDSGSGTGLNDGLTAGDSTVSSSGERSAGGVIPESTDFSIEAWVYPDSLNNGNSWHQVFQQAGDSASNYGRFGLNLFTGIGGLASGSAGVQVIVDGINKFTDVTAARVYENRWTHIALTADVGATTELKLYLNGSLIATETGAPNGSYGIRDTGFTLGYFPESFDATDRHFHGGIDQVKVWDGILSDTQVQQSMNSFGASGVTSAPYLRASLDFNEDYLDSTGNFTFSTVGTVATSTVATTTTSGTDTIVSFPRSYLTSTGGWTVPTGVSSVRALLVGGGGGGGGDEGGGGGAGQFRDLSSQSVSGTVTVTVGAGGPGADYFQSDAAFALLGGDSSAFGDLVAFGGGTGGSGVNDSDQVAKNGQGGDGYGSGGGGSGNESGYGSGTGGAAGTGNAGGTPGTSKRGGGGGGAGEAGSSTGTGGDGLPSDITGVSVTYAGGGGGGAGNSASGSASGGTGGAGNGGGSGTAPTSASANSGSGGGGGGGIAGDGISQYSGGNGGSGIVVVRYTTPVVPTTVQNFTASTRLVDSDTDADSVTLTWDALTGQTPAVTSYEIEYSTASNYASSTTQTVAVTNSAAATPNTATISGLTDGATYYFRIKARNTAGDSASYAETSSIAVSASDSATSFNGTTSFASVAGNVIPATGDYTAEAWINPDVIDLNWRTILSQGNQDGRFFLGLILYSGKYYIGVSRNAQFAFANDAAEVGDISGQWTHVAATVNDSNDSVNVYVNGALVLTTTSALVTTNSGFTIGDYLGSFKFDGQIDQVKIWNDVRSKTEIEASMHAWGYPSSADGSLIAHYDFNDNTQASVLRDQVGNNDLTYTSVATSDLKPLVEKDTSSRPGYAVYEFKRSYLTAAGGWTVDTDASTYESLLVAGGGSGATRHGGGGGAGELLYSATRSLSGTQAIVVGMGGLQPLSGMVPGVRGQSSKLGSTSVNGGGAGGRHDVNGTDIISGVDLKDGGSGGGEAHGTGSAGASVKTGSGVGNPGGTGNSSPYLGGGGGGAGSAGTNGDSAQAPGSGGSGLAYSLTGSTICYAAGGGGGGYNTSGGAGGGCDGLAATGGAGSTAQGGAQPASSAAVNTGSGGGGSGEGSVSTAGYAGAGGSGVVILAYSLAPSAPTITSVSSITATTASVAFTAPSHAPETITKYQWTSDGSTWNDISGTSSPLSVTGLSQNTTFAGFKIRAVSGSYEGTASAAATSFTTSFVLVYEPLTGSAESALDGIATTGSQGLTGNWETVKAVKQGTSPARDAQDVNLANESNFSFPANSAFTMPSSNTAAAVDSFYKLRYAARQLTTPISFDETGTYYMSFLTRSQGSSMVGLLDALPTSSSDNDDWALFSGLAWNGKSTIDFGNSNEAVWVNKGPGESGTYSASSVASPADIATSSRFFVVRFETVASGNDTVSLRSYRPSDVLPSDPSSIIWDVTYEKEIDGVANYLALQLEYNSTIDEIRIGKAFDTVAAILAAYTITYNSGDFGTGSDVTSTKTAGSPLALPNSEIANGYFSRSGYAITSWSTNADGSTSDYAFGASYSTDADETLYPVWTANNLNVTWNSNSGSSVTGSTVATDATLSAPTSPTRSGFNFAGWSATDGGTAVSFPYTHGKTADFTMFAVWERATYTVTFDYNYDGVADGTLTHNSGGTVTLPTPSSRSGYDFKGWYTAATAGTKVGDAGDTASTLSGTDLVLRYELDDPNSYGGTGTTVTDTASSISSVTGSVNGTAINGPVFSTQDGMYFEFDGTNDYLRTGNLYSRMGAGNNQVSLFAWVYPTGNGVVVSELGQTTINDFWHDSQIEVVGGKFKFRTWSPAGGSTPAVTSDSITLNQWYYVGLVYDGTKLTGYVDGVSVGSTANYTRSAPTTGLHYALAATDSTNLGDGTYGDFRLGSFHVYKSGLTAATVLDNYQATCIRFDSGCTQQTLYAQWEAAGYVVTYAAGDNGTGTSQTMSKVAGVSLTLPDSATANGYFTRTGYTVTSWSTNSNGSTSDYALGGSYSTDAIETLYPVWTPNTYTITFNKGASGTGSDLTATKTHDVAFTIPNSATSNGYFTRTGYTLTSWATNADGTGTNYAFGATYSTEAAGTLYPVWTPDTYTITFNKGASGTGSDVTATKTHDVDFTIPNAATSNGYFTRTGYTVSSWSTSADGSTSDYAFGATYSTEAADTLYPVWTANTYTVTYNYNGATGGNSAATSSYTVDGIVVSLPTPTKPGYTFAGWYSDSGLTASIGAAGASYSPSADVTAYAKWSAATFTVIYAYNDADGSNSTTSDTYTTGGTVITLPTPTRTGYTFGGWYSNSNLTDLSVVGAAGASYSPTVNLTIYAKWTAITRSVTYNTTNASSGSAPTDATDYTIGQSVVIKANTGNLVRTGYTFAGWVTNSDGSGTAKNAGETLSVATANINLYPKWSANTYTVTYNRNGATGGSLAKATDNYTTGQTPGLTLAGGGTMTKTGYSFAGWSSSTTGTIPLGTFTTTTNVTLYAIWSPVDYTLSYDLNTGSGSAPSDQAANVEETVTVSGIGSATKTGHWFAGWNSASDGSGTSYAVGSSTSIPVGGETVYAIWVPDAYKISYNANGGTGGPDLSATDGFDTATFGQSYSIRPKNNIARTGYTFSHWTTSAADSGTKYDSAQNSIGELATYTPTANTVFYAQWTAVSYSLTFETNGGSAAIGTQSRTIGQTLSMPSAGTKTGYTFDSWSDGVNSYPVGSTYTVAAANAAFTAQWIPNVYTVTYDWQGGVASGSAKSADSYTVGTGAMTLPTAIGSSYSRDGYDFAGWSTSAGGSAVSSFEPTADDVLYALWDDGNFTLSYDAKGGTGSGAGSVARTGSITLPTPVRSNFTFVGWYNQATGGSKLADGGASYTPVASTSFYARWVQNSLYGVDEATLETAATLTVGGDQSGGSLTRNHSATGTAASVVVPNGALPANTVVTARYFKDTERQSGLIPGDNNYVFSLLVSWLTGSGDSATVPNTATGKPITVTLTSSAIKTGQMIYQVVGTTVTELGRATSDGSITVELTEDPEIVIAATKPSAPTSVSAVAGDTQATVSWSAPESGGSAITSYTVTSTPGSFTCTTATTSCVVTGLTNGTSYTFTVTASNSVGTSTSSGSSSSIAVAATTYNASFNANGGSSVSTATFIAGGSISEPTAPTRSGYTFNGWSTTLDDAATKVTFPYSPGVTTNITLYALWTQDPAPSSSGSNNTPVVAPTPKPTLKPTPPATPVTKPGGSVAGSSEQVKIVADAPKEKLVATGLGWELQVAAKTATGAAAPVSTDLNLEFQLGSAAAVSGSGLRPKTTVSVWVFSDPTFVGEVETDSAGAFDSNLVLPANILPGDHTLQVLSTDSLGRVITLNIPITVKGKVTVGSFKGYLALYTKDLLGQKLSAKVAGKWLVQDPIANYKSYGYSRIVRKTGAGYRIYVHLYLNGAFLRTDVITTK